MLIATNAAGNYWGYSVTDTIVDRIITVKGLCSLQEEDIRAAFDLSPAEYHGLCALARGERVMCRELSLRMGLSPSRGSRIVEKMVARGFLEASPHPSDRRVQQLALTPAGEKIRAGIDARREACEKEILEHLTAGQIADIKRSLDILCETLRKRGNTHELSH